MITFYIELPLVTVLAEFARQKLQTLTKFRELNTDNTLELNSGFHIKTTTFCVQLCNDLRNTFFTNNE